jgi:hypothetical protein
VYFSCLIKYTHDYPQYIFEASIIYEFDIKLFPLNAGAVLEGAHNTSQIVALDLHMQNTSSPQYNDSQRLFADITIYYLWMKSMAWRIRPL